MIPGKKMCAIFGFCDIRQFAVITEVLKSEVIVFVNTIAEIVHSCVDKFQGATNKNIGDAFLLVWKIPESEICDCVNEQAEKTLSIKENSRIVQNIADLALASFLKVIARIERSPELIAYRDHADLNKALPNYWVSMGFGLHVGWAIEGAIGSEYKIDASYLSPNVNMTSRLEAATRQFGLKILVSDIIHRLFSKPVQELCRLVDIVTVKGAVKPMGLYTVDVELGELKVRISTIPKDIEMKRHFKEKKAMKKLVMIGEFDTQYVFK